MADVAQETLRNPETQREKSDVTIRTVVLVLGIVAAMIAAVILVLLAIYPGTTRDQPKALKTEMPTPRLQHDPTAELGAYLAQARRRLATYGWVDRDKGVAHIPIDEAMRRVAEHGIPDWPAGRK
jgi:hypothetical protein